MKNTSIRTGFAAAGLATLLFAGTACSSNNTANTEAANSPAAGSADAPTSGSAAAKLSSADKDFLTTAAKSNYEEIQLAQVALQKAPSKKVQDFAQKIVDDHQKLNGDLAKLAATKGVTLPDSASLAAGFSEGHLKMLSGTKFDQAFLKKMVDAHNEAITAFQNESTGGVDTDVKDFASTNISGLKEHLATAQELENGTNAKKGSKS
jgi:putative membrane protein